MSSEVHLREHIERCEKLDLPMLQQLPCDHLGMNQRSCAMNGKCHARLLDPRKVCALCQAWLQLDQCEYLASQLPSPFRAQHRYGNHQHRDLAKTCPGKPTVAGIMSRPNPDSLCAAINELQ